MKSLLFIFLCWSFNALAQDKQLFTAMPALGLNGCQIHGDNYSGYDKAGIFAGIAVNASLNQKISFDLGFYFSQKGARHNQNPEKGDYSYYRVNLNYIDMPLLFRYHLNSIYFISMGPSMAYLIDYKEENERGDWTGVYKFNKFETGINFGLGRKIKERFLVEVRSSNSITPIRNYGILATQVFYPNAVARFFNKGLYNNILTLIVSYKINFKKKSGE
ncbi:MAG: porin family protein [Bacteroidota bacterium]